MPEIDSCRWADTSPIRLRTRAYERAERVRNLSVPTSRIGMIHRVARARRQSSTKSSTAAPMIVRPLVTSEVTPSVTSWSRASMSLVMRETIQPVRCRLKKSSESFWMWAKTLRRRSRMTCSPTQLTR